jgi:formylglycine-generating enzyme required for sulfatase activity
MGSPDSEAGRFTNETQHQVTISQGFWLGKYEVTQAQWVAGMGSNPSDFPGNLRPVDKVSWDDVQDYLAALNAKKGTTGGPYWLPTEAEWEYACRAGTTTRFYWGEDPTESAITNYAWYEDNANSEPHNAGTKLPNGWGLYDMSGNVYEWCQDWYEEDYPAGPVTDPEGPATGTDRVLRGGAWDTDLGGCRSAFRLYSSPDGSGNSIGFRLLRTAD